jgi:hypothetical protein
MADGTYDLLAQLLSVVAKVPPERVAEDHDAVVRVVAASLTTLIKTVRTATPATV